MTDHDDDDDDERSSISVDLPWSETVIDCYNPDNSAAVFHYIFITMHHFHIAFDWRIYQYSYKHIDLLGD